MDTALLINQGFSKPCKAITCSSLQWKVTVLSAIHIASCLACPRWLSEEAMVILTAMADSACSCLQMHFDNTQCMGEPHSPSRSKLLDIKHHCTTQHLQITASVCRSNKAATPFDIECHRSIDKWNDAQLLAIMQHSKKAAKQQPGQARTLIKPPSPWLWNVVGPSKTQTLNLQCTACHLP